MNSLRLVLPVTLALCVSAPLVRAAPPVAPPVSAPAATAEVESLVSAIRSNRKALIAVNLGLTDDEAAKFWPVYDRYQKEINAIGDRQLAIINDYIASFATLQDDKALKLMDDYLAVE
ncbi:MAG: hypothetical protein ACREBE_07885, partial [bacterium]